MQWFGELSPVFQAFLATCFTWLVTAGGAGVVIFFQGSQSTPIRCRTGFCRRGDDCRQLLVAFGSGNRNGGRIG